MRRPRHSSRQLAGGAFLYACADPGFRSGNGEGGQDVSEEAHAVYRRAALALGEAKLPFLVGGAFALAHYTPVVRDTKDFDIFVRQQDVPAIMDRLQAAGFRTDLTFPHWLAKAFDGEVFIDLIFSSGNGVAQVDDVWFERARTAPVLGMPMLLCPPEEMLWSKAFVLERERFDGADVLHLIRDQGAQLDWERLLRRFGRFWRVLYAHLVLFGFVFPGHRSAIPPWVMQTLGERMRLESASGTPDADLAACQGTLLSREQYLNDVESLGYRDVRLYHPDVNMSEQDVARWTDAIPGRRGNGGADPGSHR
jgi:hypothetical protein